MQKGSLLFKKYVDSELGFKTPVRLRGADAATTAASYVQKSPTRNFAEPYPDVLVRSCEKEGVIGAESEHHGTGGGSAKRGSVETFHIILLMAHKCNTSGNAQMCLHTKSQAMRNRALL